MSKIGATIFRWSAALAALVACLVLISCASVILVTNARSSGDSPDPEAVQAHHVSANEVPMSPPIGNRKTVGWWLAASDDQRLAYLEARLPEDTDRDTLDFWLKSFNTVTKTADSSEHLPL